MTDDLAVLTRAIGEQLVRRGERLAVAESCTGGWAAKVCTDLPGSSAWFDCGFVSYSNAAKQAMLGVRAETLDAKGAVSEATVVEMANGVLERSAATWSFAVSGIAGPDGGTPGKPVGTVWFAWAGRDTWQFAERRRFDGDRDAVRRQSVAHALSVLLHHLQRI